MNGKQNKSATLPPLKEFKGYQNPIGFNVSSILSDMFEDFESAKFSQAIYFDVRKFATSSRSPFGNSGPRDTLMVGSDATNVNVF
jgi:hypothetical protein